MKIAILHHHLNPGGVTRIIQSQVSSLRKKFPEIDIQLLSGHVQDIQFFKDQDVHTDVNPDLNYVKGRDLSGARMIRLKDEISNFLSQKISPDTIIHAHNLNLGKNPVLTLALSEMAAQGYKLFNHCHDFAEDRPENMKFLKEVIEGVFKEDMKQVCYPDYPNYLFGAINTFDQDRIKSFGIEKSRVVHLPNPVHFRQKRNFSKHKARPEICKELGLDEDKLVITYPVRVIRRKNIGELILLSVVFEDKAGFAVTQAPKNPEEIISYKSWKQFCKEQKIGVRFEAGTKVDFEKLLVASDACISTSTREGFGMVFLEPWLLGTPVIGRNISYVTKDLEESGVEFPVLYNEINVEFENNILDFAELDEEKQQALIGKIRNDTSGKKKIRDMNPKLKLLFEVVPDELIEKNKRTILEKYSLENYANRLNEIYRKLA
jgi:glycosyltransferase involved in cell wall biosynthesis